MLLALLLAGCRGCGVSLPWDADRDGVDASEDCADADGTAFPGADEVCDGVDNDCDGEVDEDPIDGDTFYVDVDGDTWGDAPIVACDGVTRTGDCDERRRDIHPHASEVCDGVDDDCDGEIDEVRAWRDADGDGYGDWADEQPGCPLPEGYVLLGSDCDDADAGVSPSAAEVHYDGVDQDCDGRSDYDADRDGDDASAWGGRDCDDTDAAVDWDLGEVCANGIDDNCDGGVDDCVDLTFSGRFVGDLDAEAGAFLDAGDLDGDGVEEAIVGSRSGVVWVVGTPIIGVTYRATARIAGDAVGGVPVAALGDVDGDGFGDLLVEAWEDRADVGADPRVRLFRGPVSGILDRDDAALSIAAKAGVGAPGDVDGDGRADALMGGESGSDCQTELRLGPLDGGMAACLDIAGFDTAAQGDVDGDGLLDLIVGSGAVYVFTTVADAGPADADATFDSWASPVAADLDGDGHLDLALAGDTDVDSEPLSSGALMVWRGPLAGTYAQTNATLVLRGERAHANAEVALALPGVDGADLLVGADCGSEDAEAVCAYVVSGALTGAGMLGTDSTRLVLPGIERVDALEMVGDTVLFGSYQEGTVYVGALP
ncbi:MAG: MopE-related protein [Pseudomonadota bacterium]|nr:MopE-related protein [Pseudomonadota bacterium]